MSEKSNTQQHTVDLTRVFGDVELPSACLWNIPPGWATVELSVPRLLGTTMRWMIRLKQGMIAIADDASHSTPHLSLCAPSIRTGVHSFEQLFHNELLDHDRR